jgi:hypothetical protein
LNKKNFKDPIIKRNVNVGSLNFSKTATNDMGMDFRRKLLDLQRQQKEFAYTASSSLSAFHFIARSYEKAPSFCCHELEFDYYFFKDVLLKEFFLANTIANNSTKMNASSLVSSFLTKFYVVGGTDLINLYHLNSLISDPY